jgi:GT2 family glycosyltransferase
MTVSVIIINYNTFDLTCQCIQSIIDQTTDIDYEIILVDNASIEKDPSDFIKYYPQITLIANNVNVGFAKGNNLGIQKARGELVLLLNSDTKLANNAIKIAADFIRSYPEIGVLSGQLLNVDKSPQPIVGRFPSLSREILELLRLVKFIPNKKKFYLFDRWDYNCPTEADYIWGAFFMFHKSDLKHFPNQRLHDNFFMYGEDLQWCYHFKKKLKKQVYYLPGPKVYHYIGGSDKSNISFDVKFANTILPNRYNWMMSVHGYLYTKCYFLIKTLLHLSLRSKMDIIKAKIYFSLVKSKY